MRAARLSRKAQALCLALCALALLGVTWPKRRPEAGGGGGGFSCSVGGSVLACFDMEATGCVTADGFSHESGGNSCDNATPALEADENASLPGFTGAANMFLDARNKWSDVTTGGIRSYAVVYIDNHDNLGSDRFLTFLNGGVRDTGCALEMRPGPTFRPRCHDGTLGSSAAISLDTRYCVQMEYDVDSDLCTAYLDAISAGESCDAVSSPTQVDQCDGAGSATINGIGLFAGGDDIDVFADAIKVETFTP